MTSNPNQLAKLAKCYIGIPRGNRLPIMLYILAAWLQKKNSSPIATVFSYVPETDVITWIDKNGSQTGTLLTFQMLADMASVSSVDLSNNLPNQITELTGLASLPALTTLNINHNHLTSLDISGNPLLTTLYAQYSFNLTTPGLKLNTALTYLDLSYSQAGLTSLDLTVLPNLSYLAIPDCYNITSVLGISNKLSLTYVNVFKTLSLRTIDCHGSSNLSTFYTKGAQLWCTNLNLNGCAITNSASTYYINYILSTLLSYASTNIVLGGTVNIAGGTNAAPSAAGPNGIAAANSLRTTWVWTVTTN